MEVIDGTGTKAEGEMKKVNPIEEGHASTVECVYCGRWIPDLVVPAADDDRAWQRLDGEHREGCEWVRTRAHHLMEDAKSRGRETRPKPSR